MTTLISHIYNEEFLLPYFIKWHYAKFDEGIILDYGSNDKSLEILRDLAPKWRIIELGPIDFEAEKLDDYIEDLEKEISGIRITLTVTEFLVGDPRLVQNQLLIPTISLLRLDTDRDIQADEFFHEKYFNGIVPSLDSSNGATEWLQRHPCRSIHSRPRKYPRGRHFPFAGFPPLLIYRVSNCLGNEKMIERRLQIQKKIPITDIQKGYGIQHTNGGNGLTYSDIRAQIEIEKESSENVKELLEKYLILDSFSTKLNVEDETFKILRNITSQFEKNQELLLLSNARIQADLENVKVELTTAQNMVIQFQQDIEKLEEDKGVFQTEVNYLTLELNSERVARSRPSSNLKDFARNLPKAIECRGLKVLRLFKIQGSSSDTDKLIE